MEKIKYIIIYLTIINILNATTVYENGEDGETLGWRVQQNGEEAKNIFSNALKSRVIRLEARVDHGYWELSLAIWLGAIKKRSGYLGRCYWVIDIQYIFQ